MSFSLQPKKFVNSEHIGSYAEFELPFGKNEAQIAFKIHYIEEGIGQPLVLVHSAGQSLYTWNAVFKDLAQKYRVIAIDLAGHGYSDTSQFCKYGIEEQAQILQYMLNRLGISSAHFVGFSLGCAVVARFVALHPKRVGRIIMISPGGITPKMPGIIKMLGSRMMSSIAIMFLNKSTVQKVLNECYLDLTMIDENKVKQYYAPLENYDTKRAVKQMVCTYDDNEFMRDLSQIEVPILLLIASDDKWRSSEDVQPYFDLMKNGSSSVIRNAGHLMHEEKPEKSLAAINSFIAPDDTDENTDDTDENKEDTDENTDSDDK